MNLILNIYGFETLFYTLSYIEEKIMMYSYLASMINIQCMYLHTRSLKLRIWIKIFTNIKVVNNFFLNHFKNELNLDGITINQKDWL